MNKRERGEERGESGGGEQRGEKGERRRRR